jgi:hypothetical protein
LFVFYILKFIYFLFILFPYIPFRYIPWKWKTSDGYTWKDTINHFTLRALSLPVVCSKCRHNIYTWKLWLYTKISVVDSGKHILCTSKSSRVLTHSTNALNSNISSYRIIHMTALVIHVRRSHGMEYPWFR